MIYTNTKIGIGIVSLIMMMLSMSCHQLQQTSYMESHTCEKEYGFQFICGPVAAEDIVTIPNSPWLITSGLNVGIDAHLYLVHSKTFAVYEMYPSSSTRNVPISQYSAACDGPPNLSGLSTTGLGLLEKDNGKLLLFAANDGDRFAIEVFDVVTNAERPSLKWIGCLPLPEGRLPNSVVPLRNGTVIVSSFYNPLETENEWQRMANQEPTGAVLVWQNDKFTLMDTGPLSGANGLAVSHDENDVYISAWSSATLVIYSMQTGERRELALDFLPDNITTQQDGSLLIAGQASSVTNIAACTGPSCPQPWLVARVEPESGKVSKIVERQGNELFSYATAAIEINGQLFITGRGNRSLMMVEASLLSSQEAE